MVATDKGYGNRGGGGTGNDSQDVAPADPTSGRSTQNDSIPRPITTRELGLVTIPAAEEEVDDGSNSASSTRQYLFISEQPDRLVCRRIKDGAIFTGEGDSEDVLIAKAQNARRSLWENQTIGGILYTYPEELDHSLRIATRVGEDQTLNPPVYQRYVNPFISNFSLIYASLSEDGTNSGALDYVDNNNDGRQWAVERPLTVEEIP